MKNKILEIGSMAAVLFFTGAVQAAEKVYTCASGDCKASTAQNWQDGVIPVDGDTIVLDASAANSNLTWDIDVTLAGWRQEASYSGTVTFMTGISRLAGGKEQTTHGVLDDDGVTRVLKVTGDVTVNGGKWTHKANPAMKSTEEAWTDGKGIYRLIAKIGGDYSLGVGASNVVSALGYPSASGPGYISRNYSGSHGGIGINVSYAYNYNNLDRSGGAKCYGSIKRPVTLGSGGYGKIGGGAVVIEAAGVADIAGKILADGAGGADQANAAGGAVLIKAGSVTISGEISCDGGRSTNYGGGGGGRIALVVTDAEAILEDIDRTKLHANAGTHGSWSAPGNGTIYFETPADGGRGELYINGNGRSPDPCMGACIHDDSDDNDFRRVTFANKGMLALLDGGVLKVDEIVGVSDDTTSKGIWMAGGTLVSDRPALTNDGASIVASARSPFYYGHVSDGGTIRVNGGEGTFVMKNTGAAVIQVDSPLSVEADLELAEGANVSCCTWDMMHKYYTGSHRGTYALQKTGYMSTNRLVLVVKGDLTVPEGAKISAVDKGHNRISGTGCPTLSGLRGASYGGRAIGYDRTMVTAVPDISPAYGDIRKPVDPGSGGAGGAGGGIIDLTVEGKITLDGTITANSSSNNHGPGSGGSVLVTAGEIVSPAGTGRISADAGDAPVSTYYCASGGGRVAVVLTKEGSNFSGFGLAPGQITAYGSRASLNVGGSWILKRYGGPGTVYLRTAAQAIDEGTLIIDNGEDAVTWSWADITTAVTGHGFGDVVLRGNSVLHLDADVALSVKGSWMTSAGASVSNAPGALVEFTGDAAATISGTNEFCRLACRVPGKTLKFGGVADSLLKVRSDGLLTLAGGEDDLLALRPAVDGALWPVAVCAGAAIDIESVDVSMSDASFGEKITANNSTGEDAGNVNWSFFSIYPGQTIVWNGAVDSNWLSADNWDLGRAPIDTDVVVIPEGCSVYPAVSKDFTASNVTVRSGARIDVDAALSVSGTLTLAGELSGSGTLIFAEGSTADISGEALSSYTGGIVADIGAHTRTFALGNVKLASFSATLEGGTLSLPAGVSARHVAIAGTGAVVFGAGSSSAVEYLNVSGSAERALALFAPDAGTWKLDVTRQALVDGVTCGGSDASGGIAVSATGSEASGAVNINWSFAGKRCVWSGGAGTTDWSTPGNWSSGTLPGEGDVVVLDGGADIVAAEEIVACDIYLDSGSLRLAEGGSVANGIDVAGGATLTVDKPLCLGNSMYLRSGSKLTHTANGDTELYKIDIEVGGEFVLEEGASINVMGKGYAAVKGPGAGRYQGGGSYGGRGSDAGSATATSIVHVKDCYGSVRNPVDLGSGGASSAGGGAVIIKAGGVFTLEGDIICRGNRTHQYSGSGGSVNITCAQLVGSGTIDANAGYYSGSGWAGGGGRIALALTLEGATFDSFTGKATAYGCIWCNDAGLLGTAAGSSCGTVFRRVKNDPVDGGEVLIDGFGATKTDAPVGGYYALDLCTQIPARGVGADSPRSFANTRFIVRNGGTLFLPCDLRVGDLDVQKGGRIRLDGHTLTVVSPLHRDREGWVNQSPELNSTLLAETDATDGKIVWQKPGLFIIVR